MSRMITIITTVFCLLSCNPPQKNTNRDFEIVTPVKSDTVFLDLETGKRDSLWFLGKLNYDNEQFSVYNCFTSIPLAISIKGQSRLILVSEKKLYSFLLDIPELLPERVSDSQLIFKNGKCSFSLTDGLFCTPNGCFENEMEIDSQLCDYLKSR